MRVRIPTDEWNIDALKPDRRDRLSCAPDGELLIEMLVREIEHRPVHVQPWEDALNKRGYRRAKVSISCCRDTFDYLFNGPTGYRAHYYRSPCVGVAYNRAITQAVALKVISLNKAQVNFAQRISLTGPWSKIWPVGDGATFGAAPENQLRAKRWVEHNVSATAMGLRAPLPDRPEIGLIGTWVDPCSGEVWLSPDKQDRAMDLHRRGFT